MIRSLPAIEHRDHHVGAQSGAGGRDRFEGAIDFVLALRPRGVDRGSHQLQEGRDTNADLRRVRTGRFLQLFDQLRKASGIGKSLEQRCQSTGIEYALPALEAVRDDAIPRDIVTAPALAQHFGVVDFLDLEMIPPGERPCLTDAASRHQVVGRARQQQQQCTPIFGVGLRLNRQPTDQPFVKQRGKFTNGGIRAEWRTAIDGEELPMNSELHGILTGETPGRRHEPRQRAANRGVSTRYKETARAAALHVRAKSARSVLCSTAIGSVGGGCIPGSILPSGIRARDPGSESRIPNPESRIPNPESRTFVYCAPMPFVDIIARKRDGRALSREDIDTFVSGVTSGAIPDYQASALLMAIVIKGMNDEETGWLAGAMARSGERVDLSDVPGFKVGKHSTGGVGDKVSIVLAPVAAACGVVVPKMSGRGLGHTGGTLDKLESIPGYRIDLTIEEFKQVLREVGTSIIGQTSALAPADKKLYALRDVTATVPSIPLISASIMSKKLAEGSSALVLDVKCGDGAFMKDLEDARALAVSMVAIGTQAGVRTEAVLTDMSAPLGRAVGNTLEIIECLETLKGTGPTELTGVIRVLARRMVMLAGVDRDETAAARRVDDALSSGRALQVFAKLIERQGGNARIVDDYSLLPSAPDCELLRATRGGFITAMHAEAVGRASHALGAGRSRVGDAVDHGVGIVVTSQPGDSVKAGDTLLELHHRGGRNLEAALALCREAISIGDEPPAPRQKVLGEVR